MFIGGVGRSRFGSVEEVRVVAALAQLHENVLQTHLLQLAGSVDNVDVPHQDFGVHFTLEFAEPDVDFELLLGFQSLLHFGLETSQQEGPQHGVQAFDQSVVAQTVVGVEPFVEILRVVEDIGQEEVEQSPQLVQVVLQRRSGDQQPIGCFELSDNFRQFRFLVFDAMGFVDDHVSPIELPENGPLFHDNLVRCDADVPFARQDLITDNIRLEQPRETFRWKSYRETG